MDELLRRYTLFELICQCEQQLNRALDTTDVCVMRDALSDVRRIHAEADYRARHGIWVTK